MPQDQMQLFGGDWTDEKLRTLREYMERYVVALKNQPFDLVYIDAFAGTGYREAASASGEPGLFDELLAPEPRRFLDGSARIALQIKPPFDRYVFVERAAARFRELEELKREFPELNDRIDLQLQDCNAFLQNICQHWDWRGRRAVLFLDPFGMQVDWSTLEAIAGTRAVDVWVLFPLGIAVNRLLKRNGEIPDEWRLRLDRIFGTGEWYNRFYEEQVSDTLLGEVRGTRKVANMEAIGRYYNERLGTIFAAVAENPRPLLNKKGSPLFLLCFAASNPKGAPIAIRIAQHILKAKN